MNDFVTMCLAVMFGNLLSAVVGELFFYFTFGGVKDDNHQNQDQR